MQSFGIIISNEFYHRFTAVFFRTLCILQQTHYWKMYNLIKAAILFEELYVKSYCFPIMLGQ